jgi:hypothetical protein
MASSLVCLPRKRIWMIDYYSGLLFGILQLRKIGPPLTRHLEVTAAPCDQSGFRKFDACMISKFGVMSMEK